jgi:hypothetical protein
MDGIGWEIQPAGWLFLIVLGILLIYSTIRWLRNNSHRKPGNIYIV